MRTFKSKESVIIEAAGHLREKRTISQRRISKADALAAAQAFADRRFGGQRYVDEAGVTSFIDALLALHVEDDVTIAWEKDAPEPSAVAQLTNLEGELRAQESAGRIASVLPAAPAVAGDPSFTTGFQASIGRTPPTAPAGTPSFTSPLTSGLSLLRKLEIDAEVARDLSAAVSKAVSAPVAKAAPQALQVRVIKAGS